MLLLRAVKSQMMSFPDPAYIITENIDYQNPQRNVKLVFSRFLLEKSS